MINALLTENGEASAEIAATAAHEFQPWVRGKETPITPAALHSAADQCAFLAVFFAYELMFKSKAEIATMAQQADAPECLDILLDSFGGAKDWLEQLVAILDAATARLLCGAASAASEQEAA